MTSPAQNALRVRCDPVLGKIHDRLLAIGGTAVVLGADAPPPSAASTGMAGSLPGTGRSSSPSTPGLAPRTSPGSASSSPAASRPPRATL